MTIILSSSFSHKSHWSSLLVAGLLLCAATASAVSRPCATDSKGKEIVFNTANGNPYHCSMTVTSNPDGSEDVMINQPVVGTEAKNGFEYSAVVFRAGDLVTISADGCVQTAGYGKTWKRYVDPTGDESGPNNDNGLYYGNVTVNGGVTEHGPASGWPLENMGVANPGGGKMYVEQIQAIPGRPNAQVLKLGYVDDNYDDHGGNGYWGHDNGDDNQCGDTDPKAAYGKFGGPAWIKLHIAHNAQNPFAHGAARQWDLVPQGLDPNGLYLNPAWGWQVNGGDFVKSGTWDPSCLPGCSSQDPSFDSAEATFSNWFNRFFANVCNWDKGASGHHNYFDVTYHGTVTWVEHAGGAFKDDDYNLTIMTPIYFYPPGQTVFGYAAGTTFGNNTADNAAAEAAIGMEFDSDETIDHFDQNNWWHTFHQTVDGNIDTDNPYGSDAAAGGMIDYNDAVVIGLMGFDEMHGTYTEIHPVHALAIREASEGQTGNILDPAHDRWVFFVRNWGDEGECSRFQHYLQANQITLQIPPPVLIGPNHPSYGTATLTTARSQILGTGTDGVLHFFSGPQGTFVTFNLSPATSQPFAFGEFELAWNPVPGKPGGKRSALGSKPKDAKKNLSNRPEERLQTIWDGATPDQQKLYKTLLASIDPVTTPKPSAVLKVEVQTTAPQRPAKMPGVSTAPATAMLERKAARYQALCAATNGKLPTEPTWCSSAKVPPVTILTTSGGTRTANGSYTPIVATLTVYDASGLGVGTTQYSLDGKTWKTYTGPITLPDGTYTVYHRSQDKEGNQEDIRQRAFNIKGSQMLALK